MAEGFLGRWSQRKQAVREGKPVKDLVVHADPALASAAPAASEAGLAARTDTRQRQPSADPRSTDASTPATETTQPPPLSMQDVAALNAESDFKPFVARAVAPEVRNAAMKKLFADPHFNVMDGLDIYIDDYSIPDPLPASMLRKMVSAQFLKLFDDEEKPAHVVPGPDAPVGDAPVVAQADTFGPSNPQMSESGESSIDPSVANPTHTPATETETDKIDPKI